ncbi:LOW QUALITY PROTEIN: hypothetical protein PHMEG_00022881 [Phytophthora megakarya]|uniref:Uncharacterized protein n=1 Tax=Phytophthora megakarya TaxID=4795 RepID=A0A225VJ08_9STRA|nr:LOW QUALITY PROTEIN: hypothetical protein PHMEG_00022881 [Phytophthora megakarya]
MPSTDPNDADEEMPLAQPTYEYIRGPILTDTKRQRRRYEEKIRERSPRQAKLLMRSPIKASTELRVLDYPAFYILKTPILEVSDEDRIRAIQTKAGNMMNDYVPDLERLFDRLKMNMQQADIEARVAQYFIDFDKIVEENGLIGVLCRQGTLDPALAKVRYRFLVRRLQPEVLWREVKRMAQVTHRHVKTDCISLYELVVDRVKRQHQAHLLHSKMRSSRAGTNRSDDGVIPPMQGRPVRVEQLEGMGAVSNKKKLREAVLVCNSLAETVLMAELVPPPRNGCLFCQGAHWLKDCARTSEAQKDEARNTFVQERKQQRAKRITHLDVVGRAKNYMR